MHLVKLWRCKIKMEAYKFVKLKKEEFGIKEYIKRQLGKGKISDLDIEYTPVGEKIIISTSKPGLVIGRKGEQIQQLMKLRIHYWMHKELLMKLHLH